LIFHIYSPYGRVGSNRFAYLLTNSIYFSGPWSKEDHTDPTEKHHVIHSHILSDRTDNAQYILCTRRNKQHIILSNMIAQARGAWQPQQSETVSPITVNIKDYIDRTQQLTLKEQRYIDETNPIIIYLEDSVEDIERKLGIAVEYPDKDTAYVSNYPPSEYVTNYADCISAYESTILFQNLPGEHNIISPRHYKAQ